MYPCINYYISKPASDLNRTLRLVWEQHVYWTRFVMNSIAYNLPDADFVTVRLLRNATDMGNLLKPFYGNAIAEKYSSLIKDHLVTAATLVKAAKENNQKVLEEAEGQWYQNGAEIAKLLSSINPYIIKSDFEKMFFEHLAHTKMEAVLILKNDVKSSIAIFDKIEREALQMADTIAVAIANQFGL